MNPIISNDAFSVLESLYNGENVSFSDYSESAFEQLRDYGLIIYAVIGHKDCPESMDPVFYMPIYEIRITEAGKAYYESLIEERRAVENQTRSLEEIAEKISLRVAVAEKDSAFSKKTAIISIIVSVVSIVIALLALLSQSGCIAL